MNDEIKRDRSPKAPVVPLKEAIALVKKLQSQVGRAKVSMETASKALGYSGMTGVSLTKVASLSQYQLLSRDKGQLFISPLAVRILHPTSIEQSQKSLQEAALAPGVFNELFQDYRDSSEEVIASHLIQKGFAPERAKRVARTFRSNTEYLPQAATAITSVGDEGEPDEQLGAASSSQPAVIGAASQVQANPTIVRREADASVPSTEVLARYSIPLGENEATLVFTGKSLSPEDFTALIEYVELFKKQFERRQPKDTR
jgi:hypothetical protein